MMKSEADKTGGKLNLSRTISLIGLRGAGKSSVARLLSERTGLPLLETDGMIEEEAGTSISAVFAGQGEEGFRALEAKVLARALSQGPCILSTGGGVVLGEENRRLLSDNARVVYLRADPLVLYRRVTADEQTHAQRPPLTGLDPLQEMASIAAARAPLYETSAHFTVETDRLTPPEIAEVILAWLGEP